MTPVQEFNEVEHSEEKYNAINLCNVHYKQIHQNEANHCSRISSFADKRNFQSPLLEPKPCVSHATDYVNYEDKLTKRYHKMKRSDVTSTIVLCVEVKNLGTEYSVSNNNVNDVRSVSEKFIYCQSVTKESETDTNTSGSISESVDTLKCHDTTDFSFACAESTKSEQPKIWNCQIEKEEKYTDSIVHHWEIFSWRNVHFKSQYYIVNLVSSIQLAKQVAGQQLYSRESTRIVTFRDYPMDAAKSRLLLAASGFIYKGLDDKVQCVYCGVEKQDWKWKDLIEDIHQSSCFIKTHTNSKTQKRTAIRSAQFAEKNVLSTRNTRAQVFTSWNHSSSARYSQESSLTFEVQSHQTIPANNVIDSQRFACEQISGITGQYPSVDTTTLQTQSPSNTSPQNLSQSFEQEMNSVETSMAMTPVNIEPSPFSAHEETTRSSETSVSSSLTTEVTITQTSQPTVTTNTSPQPTAPQGSVTASESRDRNSPTYEELGIMTDRPKRAEYALKIKRLETFGSWPRDHHLSPQELADAGFYYAGYGDCTRCFYCGGGLRNWEDDDDVWVEHARWFQRCAYVKQKMGQVFVSTVQNMNTEFEKITMAMVNKKLGVPSSTFYIDSLTAPLKRDPAVRAIVALGYLEKDVIEVAEMIKLEGNTISAVTIMEKLGEEKKSNIHSTQVYITLPDVGSNEANEIITQLKERNGQLRQQTACKICMDGEVSVVFLPCGHLVSCTECASAMRNCPLCRVQVRGIVRAFMGD